VNRRQRAAIRNGIRQPAAQPARSPHTPPARLVSGGYNGRNGSPATTDPTAGLRGETCPHPAGNTMRSARMGGAGITYYDPAELAREALTQSSAPMAPPHAGLRFADGQHAKTLASAEAEGFRQNAMEDHSLLRTTGAVSIDDDGQPVWLAGI
jgi:hypothetical protein